MENKPCVLYYYMFPEIRFVVDGESKCVACNKSCRTILLRNDMKPEVQMFFKPIPQLLDNIKKVRSPSLLKTHYYIIHYIIT